MEYAAEQGLGSETSSGGGPSPLRMNRSFGVIHSLSDLEFFPLESYRSDAAKEILLVVN